MTTAASPFTGVERSGPTDDIDGLFDDLLDEDRNVNGRPIGGNSAVNDTNDIDEEIKVTKKRKPVAKLDDTRLLSTAGIPKLRKISKQKFKFNGKGHEFTDMAKLLNTYQLWLDDLFPKAKFLDALAMVEKLGHKKKIQIYRKEWIDEGKPKGAVDDIDDFVANGGEHSPNLDAEPEMDIFDSLPGNNQVGQPNQEEEPAEDELDALLRDAPATQIQTRAIDSGKHAEEQEPDEDELDALLAEDPSTNVRSEAVPGESTNGNARSRENAQDNFDDEEEAMAGMDYW